MKMIQLCLLFCATLSSLHARLQPYERIAFSPEEIEAAKKIEHLIIILQENWSFDSLYGNFPGVDGIANASKMSLQQVDRNQKPYATMPDAINSKTKQPYKEIPKLSSILPFDLQPYLPLSLPTGDAVHRFYNEIRQINGGKMNGFIGWSNAGSFAMSYYDISETRMGKIAKAYTLCDRFFHSCYGSSMCGALMLFSAQIPVYPNPPAHLIIDATEKGIMSFIGKVTNKGDAVEDMQPFYLPHDPNTPLEDRLPAQNSRTIGDLLSRKKVSWGWYAEGWDKALLGKAERSFAYHHQAPTYFTQFAPGTKERNEHLFDLNEFYLQLESGEVPSVSFIRSLDSNSEHPGDASLLQGLNWCADLIEKIQASSIWEKCAIIVTYDENGGRWDHVAPPVGDAFGPGTRVPAVIISPFAKKNFVDHTLYETVSILKFIEERWELPSLSPRDARANNLLNAFDFKKN